MASTRRKSAAIALAVVGIAGLSLASAAQLNVGTGSLGAGNSIVAACQPTATPVTVNFTAALATGGTTYNAASVQLGALDAACNGKSYRIQATGATGAIGAEVTGTVSGTSISATLNAPAANVTGVSVVIYG